jgi:hypothetical protein
VNINNNLNLFKNATNELRLSKGDVNSSAMKTTVMSPEEKAVAMQLELESKQKEELKKKKEKALKEEKKNEVVIVKEDKVIERDPLKLLKLF